MQWRKTLAVHFALAAAITFLVAPLATHTSREPQRRRPRSISERMRAERETPGRGAALREEATADRGAAELGERDAFDAWFYGQRAYPGSVLPVDARTNARAHAKGHNKRDDDPEGPKWKPLGPSTIPDGQTDNSAGQLSPVSGRLNAIATHPTDPDIVYAAGAQGGVWKTKNARSPHPEWKPLTDDEASLAVGAIAIDPVNPDIIYVGTGEANRSCDSYYGQGILRSTNGGRTWTLLGATPGGAFNNPGPFVGKAVSRILIDRATAGSATGTTIWAATTIGFFSGGTIPTCDTPSGPNIGLWRSIDSGQTWELQNVPPGGAGSISVQDAAIDPNDGNIVYAAVRNTGVFKSTNAKAASATYVNMTTGFPAGSTPTPMRRINVSIGGPAAPNVLYAAVENGTGSRLFGLFKTSNGGASWTHIDEGFNGNATFAIADADPGPGVLPLVFVTRVSGPPFVTDGTWIDRRFLITPSAGTRATLSRTIYKVVDDSHLFLTTGSTAGLASAKYSVGNYPVYCDGQCFYDMTIAIDPMDPTGRRIYVGGNPHNFSPNFAPNLLEAPCDVFSQPCPAHYNWRSDDGGSRWSSISQGNGAGPSIHTDDHAYAFGPDGSLYDGNDGGIWRSADMGFSWTTMNTNIAITQFQGLSVHPTRRIVLGGTQDNGTNIRNPRMAPPPKWFHSDFGDGGMSVIDQSTPSRMFHTYFNQAFNFMGPARSDEGGAGGPGSWPFVGAYYGYGPQYYNGMDPKDDVSFYAPLTQHPAFAPNVIYFGSNRVYRSPDPQPTVAHTPSWTAVSPKLTKPAPPPPASRPYLSWIGVLPNLVAGKEVLYTGASDGRISVSSTVDGSGVAVWTAIDKAPLPNRAVTQVLPDATDRTGNTVYATFSGFNGATLATPGHVFKSTNGLSAATWTDVSGDLPDVPVNAIAIDSARSTIYVGTDIGVFQTRSGGAHWRQLTDGMPNVAVFGLAIDDDGNLVAATHGRGMFELQKGERHWSTHDR